MNLQALEEMEMAVREILKDIRWNKYNVCSVLWQFAFISAEIMEYFICMLTELYPTWQALPPGKVSHWGQAAGAGRRGNNCSLQVVSPEFSSKMKVRGLILSFAAFII